MRTITVYEDFPALCRESESFEQNNLGELMWGVCLDHSLAELFQTVIQYEMRDGKAVIHGSGHFIDLNDIMPLRNLPEFAYNESVSPVNHPEITGEIVKIYWHFDKECYYFKIEINGKLKSKRYFADELVSLK